MFTKIIFATVVALPVVACDVSQTDQSAQAGNAASVPDVKCRLLPDTPIFLEGGTFLMGQADVYAEEGPVRPTTVDGFWIDLHEVTNRQFAEFVKSTGFITQAEKPVDPAMFNIPVDQIPPDMLKPGSAVFDPPEKPSRQYSDWWRYVPGANWKKPNGPNGPVAVANEPVVHLAWDDMQAFAEWRGGRLPTEAEWEYAASAKAPPKTEQPAADEANSWQGIFPIQNTENDGFKGVSPVGCFKANANGLYDMLGNVWEVTADFYSPGHDPDDRDNPRGPSENAAYNKVNAGFASRVMKGGSYLCAPNYCQRYRPAARQGRDPGLGASNVGFRLAYDDQP